MLHLRWSVTPMARAQPPKPRSKQPHQQPHQQMNWKPLAPPPGAQNTVDPNAALAVNNAPNDADQPKRLKCKWRSLEPAGMSAAAANKKQKSAIPEYAKFKQQTEEAQCSSFSGALEDDMLASLQVPPTSADSLGGFGSSSADTLINDWTADFQNDWAAATSLPPVAELSPTTPVGSSVSTLGNPNMDDVMANIEDLSQIAWPGKDEVANGENQKLALAAAADADAGPERRVAVWDPSTGRKITGNAGPKLKNLKKYLAEHPEMQIWQGEGELAMPGLTSPADGRQPADLTKSDSEDSNCTVVDTAPVEDDISSEIKIDDALDWNW